MARRRIIGALEIGTAKVTVLVGEVHGPNSLSIIGFAESTSAGVKKGEIIEMGAAKDAVHAALSAAEKNAGVSIEGVYLSKTGTRLEGFTTRGQATVSDHDNYVGEEDIERAVENAKSKALPPGRVYIHHINTGFFLDGKAVADPQTLCGENLEASYWHVHGDEKNVTDDIRVVNGYGLDVDDMIVSSIASGSIVALEEEKENGVLVVDVGAGTTDYALYKYGRVQRTGVVPVGGEHVTNDLALGLRVNAKDAESIKVRFGKSLVEKGDRQERVMLIGDLTIGDRPLPKLAIAKIINARMEELLMILKNKLGSAISPQNLPGGIILAGGSARLGQLPELVQSVTGVEARVAENPGWVASEELRRPDYSTVIGLLYCGLRAQQMEDVRPRGRKPIMKRMARLFSL